LFFAAGATAVPSRKKKKRHKAHRIATVAKSPSNEVPAQHERYIYIFLKTVSNSSYLKVDTRIIVLSFVYRYFAWISTVRIFQVEIFVRINNVCSCFVF